MQPDKDGTSSNKHKAHVNRRENGRCCIVELQTEATSSQPDTVISITIVETSKYRVCSDDGHC